MTISSFFIPNRQLISDITRANPGVVTTTQNHGYLSGLFVRFFFPLNVGMNQLKDKVVEITVIDDTNFSFGIDTTNFDVYAPSDSSQLAQVIPVGEVADSLSQAVINNDNIMPEF